MSVLMVWRTRCVNRKLPAQREEWTSVRGEVKRMAEEGVSGEIRLDGCDLTPLAQSLHRRGARGLLYRLRLLLRRRREALYGWLQLRRLPFVFSTRESLTALQDSARKMRDKRMRERKAVAEKKKSKGEGERKWRGINKKEKKRRRWRRKEKGGWTKRKMSRWWCRKRKWRREEGDEEKKNKGTKEEKDETRKTRRRRQAETSSFLI